MKLGNWWMLLVLILILGMPLSGCGPASEVEAEDKERPYVLDKDKTLHLIPKAAERLDIQTAKIRDEQATRMFSTWGEVVTLDGSKPAVRVRLHEGDLNKVDKGQPANILLAGGSNPIKTNPPVTRNSDTGQASPALYYMVEGDNQSLVQGRYVRVELARSGGAALRKVIPYSAVLYDVEGKTWVYVSPESLTYKRQEVTVDYIDGDLAYLIVGPPDGATIVTVGVSELWGAESGVGH